MKRGFNMAALVALIVASVARTAHAGAVLDGSNDRVDLGTMGVTGGQMEDADGWSISLWLKTTQVSCGGLFAYSQNSATADGQNQWFMFPCGHNGASLVNNDDHVVIDMGDCGDTGWLWQKELANTSVNDGNLHHIVLTVIGVSVAASRVVNLYIDGALDAGAWTKTFDDAYGVCGGNPFTDFTSTVPFGARKITTGCPGACEYFDFLAGTFADYRFYTRALSAAEVTELYVQRGRDSVTDDLLRRWDLQINCREPLANATCTEQNGPTYSTAYELSGVRRR
jgi:hypothetical protein